MSLNWIEHRNHTVVDEFPGELVLIEDHRRW
jgi:hypothetical protein